ncbi:MAG TPA: hypothetical protein VD887_04770 [Allosphingosinicella sp.]|nr:hypothetical protein [Allosphingosinicella sp.]
MLRALAAFAVLPATLAACGGNDASQAQPAEWREPGLYEVAGRVGNLSGLDLPPAEEAELRRQLDDAPPRRECLLGGRPAVGDPFQGGRCRYTRVADRGAVAERSIACAPAGGTLDTIEISGTTSRDRYALRILTRRSDAATGRALREVETFEDARRLGACPR